MRVTKTVKGYIEEKVTKKYADRLQNIGAEYKQAEKEVNEWIFEQIKEFDKTLRTQIAEKYPQYNFKPTWGDNIINSNRDVEDYSIKNDIRLQKDEIIKERNQKITDIIVELELGGNRETLEKMLGEL